MPVGKGKLIVLGDAGLVSNGLFCFPGFDNAAFIQDVFRRLRPAWTKTMFVLPPRLALPAPFRFARFATPPAMLGPTIPRNALRVKFVRTIFAWFRVALRPLAWR